MVSTFSPNLQFEEPARGDQNNAWAPTVNAIMTTIDLACGGSVTISATALPLTLSAAQFKNKTITFNSTLTANVTVTFPTSFMKTYEIQHQCTGSSNFTITLATTAAGGQAIGVPPGETISILSNGGSLSYMALHRVGDFWDHGGSSVPSWVSVCTVPPYLNCDGTAFSSATYPALHTIRNGNTTLPDSRGRSRYNLNLGTGRITAGISGVDGNSFAGAGGNESMQSHTHSVSDPTHNHGINFNQNNNAAANLGTNITSVPTAAATINAALTGISINNFGVGGSQNMPPAYIGGLTMIRAA